MGYNQPKLRWQWPPAPRGTLAAILGKITAAADTARAGTEPTQPEQTHCNTCLYHLHNRSSVNPKPLMYF